MSKKTHTDNIELAIKEIGNDVKSILARLAGIESKESISLPKVSFNKKHYKRIVSDNLVDLGGGIYGEAVEMQRVKFGLKDITLEAYVKTDEENKVFLSENIVPQPPYDIDSALWEVECDSPYTLQHGVLTIRPSENMFRDISPNYYNGIYAKVSHPDLTGQFDLWMYEDDFNFNEFVRNLEGRDEGTELVIEVRNRYLPKTQFTQEVYQTLRMEVSSQLSRVSGDYRFMDSDSYWENSNEIGFQIHYLPQFDPQKSPEDLIELARWHGVEYEDIKTVSGGDVKRVWNE